MQGQADVRYKASVVMKASCMMGCQWAVSASDLGFACVDAQLVTAAWPATVNMM